MVTLLLQSRRLEKIGFVLQSYNLVPFLTVEEQFKLVDKLKRQNLTEQKMHELLSDLGLLELPECQFKLEIGYL